jgi:hypothetical protein
MKLRLHYLEERLRACLDGDEPLQLHYANVDLRYFNVFKTYIHYANVDLRYIYCQYPTKHACL